MMVHRLLKPLLISISFILAGGSIHGAIETREYDVTVAGFNIGEMIATRETRGDDLTHYTLKSTVSFWFFVRINVEYIVTSVYRHDHLITSRVVTNSNKGRFLSTIIWNNDHYQVNVDGYKYKNHLSIKDTIAYNSARMYFERPADDAVILADNYGVVVPTENLSEEVYGVSVEGNRNKFFFKQGKVEHAVMHHPIKNFEVRLKR